MLSPYPFYPPISDETATFVQQICKLAEEKNLNEVYQRLLERERSFDPNGHDSYSGGLSPEATLEGQTWSEYILANFSTSEPLRILDLGVGRDCKLWCAPLDEITDQSTQVIRTTYPLLSVTAQSLRPVESKYRPTQNNRIRFLDGYFADVLDELIGDGSRFDVILSRHSLYMSVSAIELLPKVDDLLAADGVAFLDTVGKNTAENRFLFFPDYQIPQVPITREIVWGSSNIEIARVGGLNWQPASGVGSSNRCTAWKKGHIDSRLLPQMTSVALFAGQYQQGFFESFRVVYPFFDDF